MRRMGWKDGVALLGATLSAAGVILALVAARAPWGGYLGTLGLLLSVLLYRSEARHMLAERNFLWRIQAWFRPAFRCLPGRRARRDGRLPGCART